MNDLKFGSKNGRSLHGERGLKSEHSKILEKVVRRSLHGERGLKLISHHLFFYFFLSLPSRGAWIEIAKAT